MTEHPAGDAALTRRELRELERRRILQAAAALAELAASPAVLSRDELAASPASHSSDEPATPVTPSPTELDASPAAPSPDQPERPARREAWRPPAVPTSAGPALTRRELRQRNVEVEPLRLSVPSQSSAPAIEVPSAAREGALGDAAAAPGGRSTFGGPMGPGGAPVSGVTAVPVSAIRAHAQDQDPRPGSALPVSALAAAVQGRRAGMRDATAGRALPVDALAPGGAAIEAGGSLALAARTGPTSTQDVEPPVATDGFGMPAVFMDAPVMPALRPIEEIEAELSHEALGGSSPGDGPASPEPDEATGSHESGGPHEPGRLIESSSGAVEPAAGAAESAAGLVESSSGPAESAAGPVESAAGPTESAPPSAAEPSGPVVPAGPTGAPPARRFEPRRATTVPSPRTVASQRRGLEHGAAAVASAAPDRKSVV